MRSRTIIIAGAGIGGLTMALALAAKGFRIVVLDQAERLEATGAGLQLSPNAARVLLALGLRERLAGVVVAPTAIRVMAARTAQEILRIPLGEAAQRRYDAPYWVIHRGDLHTALLAAAADNPDITLELGCKVDAFATYPSGITVHATRRGVTAETFGIALVGADGLWSSVRARLGEEAPPRFAHRVAWRATVPAETVAAEFRTPIVHLWLGRDSHLVHYPVNAGRAINIVAIAQSGWQQEGWGLRCDRSDALARFSERSWAAQPRALLQAPANYLKWALFDRPPLQRWGRGPVTLIGDAAHPMLPFLAQGAAMAIEDAAVLAACIGKPPTDSATAAPKVIATAMRNYEEKRRARTADIQRGARINATLYHLSGPVAHLRNMALRSIGGDNFLQRYDWIYDWKLD
jgi:salicylate hydroxylase